MLLTGDRRGAMAVEFGLTGTAFLAVVLFVVALGFRIYVHVALDYACSRAARMLSVDSKHTLSGSNQQFQTVSFCPILAIFVQCTGLTLSLQTVTSYQNTSGIGSGPPPFNPGQGGSLMLLQAQYTMPAMSWLLPGVSGGTGSFTAAAITASYPYENEY